MVKLTARLATIASIIPKGSIVADIGTDHGLLPVYLVQQGISSKVYAMDNKPEPLQSAQNNIQFYRINTVVPILSDGLTHMPEDCDTLVIAGLGASTILEILSNDQKLASIQSLIIQSNIGVEIIRKWSSTHHWAIIKEFCVKDNNIIYDILQLAPGKQLLTSEEILFGPHFLQNKDDLFKEKWQNQLDYYKKIFQSIPEGNRKKEEYKQQIELIKKIIHS